MKSSLKPVPSLHKKLMLDQPLSRDTETAYRVISNAECAEPPVNLIREGEVLVSVELQEAAPFLVGEVSPNDHIECLSVERLDDSTVLSFGGIEQPIVEWALDYGITPGIIIARLERGMTVADAIVTPMAVAHAGQQLPIFHKKQADRRPRKRARRAISVRYSHDGEALTIGEWADRTGFCEHMIRKRLRTGWSIEQAVSTPPTPRGNRRTPPGWSPICPLPRGPARGAPRKSFPK